MTSLILRPSSDPTPSHLIGINLNMLKRDSLWVTKDIPIRKILRVLGALCQELDTKEKSVFLYHMHLPYSWRLCLHDIITIPRPYILILPISQSGFQHEFWGGHTYIGYSTCFLDFKLFEAKGNVWAASKIEFFSMSFSVCKDHTPGLRYICFYSSGKE